MHAGGHLSHQVVARSGETADIAPLYDPAVLWHVSDVTTPVRADLAATFIQAELGRVGGVSSYSKAMRDKFRPEVFIPDTGAIPEDEQVTEPKSCRQKHKGLCPKKHGEHFNVRLASAWALQKWLLKNTQHGEAVKICIVSDFVEEPPPSLYFIVSYLRKANPVAVVLAACKRRGGPADIVDISANESGDS